jgi:Rrf2 family protein
MLRLNRTTEYGLMALKHLSQYPTASAREFSEKYGLPFEITAKTLLRMKGLEWIQSAQGVKGGYRLTCDLYQLSLGDLVQGLEGAPSLTMCCGASTKAGCEFFGGCDIRAPIQRVNQKLNGVLSQIKLSEMLGLPPKRTLESSQQEGHA